MFPLEWFCDYSYIGNKIQNIMVLNTAFVIVNSEERQFCWAPKANV